MLLIAIWDKVFVLKIGGGPAIDDDLRLFVEKTASVTLKYAAKKPKAKTKLKPNRTIKN